MKNIIADHAEKGAKLRLDTFRSQAGKIELAAKLVAESLSQGGKILLCGNGGSAADAQHLAAEWVNRFRLERPGLAAIALTIDASVMTSVSNDYGYEQIFARQIKALGREGDVLIAISTSGRSPNVLMACEVAKELKLDVVGMCGAADSPLEDLSDIAIIVDGASTALIQEVQIAVGHMLCDLSERLLFPDQ